jgi:2-oxoglutarate dehydrogenase E1 component
MDKYSYLSNADGSAIEHLYDQYLNDPQSVDAGWQQFFDGFEFARKNYEDSGSIPENMHTEFKVINLIDGYRSRGHLFTKTNPVRERRKYSPTLDIENFGLTDANLSDVFQAGEQLGIGPATLKTIIDHLEETYCQSIGIEYTYMRRPERVRWLRDCVDVKNRPTFSKEEKVHLMHKLNQATVFEQFLQKKFVGQKRFSLEGGEALIPALDALVEKGSRLGIEEFVFGMAHRGRLNVLANIFNKTYEAIFSEFEGKEYEDSLFDGDVKYHLGISCDVVADSGAKVHLTMSPNPSHLEAVDPVVQGISRAIIDHDLKDNGKICPVLIHGDAAIAGQGVVYELIQMAQLDGYTTGGTVHIVINNQVGFTTNYKDARSSTYCTDVAKTTLCPVFHVNGDDIEAVVQTIVMALEYRQEFKRDVFIDLLCYRKYGHNEGDEPKFTQPKLYKAIASHPSPREIYKNQLVSENVLSKEEILQMEKKFDDMLQDRLADAKEIEKAKVTHFLQERWSHLHKSKKEDFDSSPETGFPKEKLIELGRAMSTLPQDKKFFRKVRKLMQDRLDMLDETKEATYNKLDWGTAEMLGYATLLDEGYPVRVSGQDVERGTFSHRHAVVKTEDDEEELILLNSLNDTQAQYSIYNSLLSEYAVLGFEYGYAFTVPDGLTIWEAQFGDFNNGAQIIIDQFIAAAEDKWHTMNGLVMLLPHGYEGMGSEHSSGRMERFLMLCAEENMQVVNCTTPASFFHVLRRQLHRDFRKPLIVFSPKKLLRLKEAVSTLDELATGRFHEVIDDVTVNPNNVDTVALCSGKVYYDILEEQKKIGGTENLAIVRLEQLFPVPSKQLDALKERYPKAKKWIWMQEEPENMGAWSHMLRSWRSVELHVISRPASGSPAAGSLKVFQLRQQAILDELFSYAMITSK